MPADTLPIDHTSGGGSMRITEEHWARLQGHLLASDVEHAALLVCGVSSIDDGVRLLVREVVELGDSDYVDRGALHLAVAPATLARVAKRARSTDSAVVLVHSHPFPGRVRASGIDLTTELDLCGRVLVGRTGQPSAALVVGPDGLDGRIWTASGASPLRQLTVVGDNVATHSVSSYPLGTSRPETIGMDRSTARQELLWGDQGQRTLRGARVVVVGCGGTGSHVAQQLAHLRVGSIALIDSDLVEETNLSRLIGSVPSDVGRSKVDVLAEHVRRISPGIAVDAVATSVLDVDPRLLTGADVIVCATDGHGSRALLTELVQQYLIPVVDLGVEVAVGVSGLRAGGGVRVLRPGSGCLWCAQTLDPAKVREEYLTDAERADEVRRGYIRDWDEPSPSVVALNGTVASLAVLEVCQLLVGMLGTGKDRLLYRAEARRMSTVGIVSRQTCHVCGVEGSFAKGDAVRIKTRWREGPPAA